MSRRPRVATWALAAFVSCVWSFVAHGAGEQAYLLARAPQRSVALLAQSWGPFAAYLSEKTGARIELKLFSERQQFESALVAGEPDLLYANPGYFIVARELHVEGEIAASYGRVQKLDGDGVLSGVQIADAGGEVEHLLRAGLVVASSRRVVR